MTRLSESDCERILEMYRRGIGPTEIAAALRLKYTSVKHYIARKRKELGTASVPYINEQSKFRPKKAACQPKAGAFAKDEITTWAGAFKVLAHRVRDSGDAEGWAYAQQIAKAKGMAL